MNEKNTGRVYEANDDDQNSTKQTEVYRSNNVLVYQRKQQKNRWPKFNKPLVTICFSLGLPREASVSLSVSCGCLYITSLFAYTLTARVKADAQ